MKSIKQLFYSLFIAAALISCGSDDDAAPVSVPVIEFGTGVGSANLGMDSFILDKGLSTDYGANGNGTFNIDLELFSGDININVAEQSLSGTGNYLYFEMNSSGSNGLETGTYTINQGSPENLSITSAEYAIGMNFANFDSTNFVSIESGTVVLARSGNDYSLTFDLINEDGESLTGMYTGTILPVPAF